MKKWMVEKQIGEGGVEDWEGLKSSGRSRDGSIDGIPKTSDARMREGASRWKKPCGIGNSQCDGGGAELLMLEFLRPLLLTQHCPSLCKCSLRTLFGTKHCYGSAVDPPAPDAPSCDSASAGESGPTSSMENLHLLEALERLSLAGH